jgi:arginase family enzyme
VKFIEARGIQLGEEGIARALDGASCAYVALDADVLEPSEAAVFMPEPGGLTISETERILAGIVGRTKVVGAGLSGATFEPANVSPLARLVAALL